MIKMARFSPTFLLHVALSVLMLLLNISCAESRRGGTRQRYRPTTSTRSAHMPWWGITFIFVGGVLALFFCIWSIRKVYEKQRQKKTREMFSRRSQNIQRRASQQRENNAAAANGLNATATPARCENAPPTYDQTVSNDALPPAYYYKEVTDDDDAQATPSSQRDSVSTTASMHLAPPSYDIAQNDGSEVVEVGGAVGMEAGRDGQNSQNPYRSENPA